MAQYLNKQQLGQLQEILNAKEIAIRIRTRVTIPDDSAEADTPSTTDVNEGVTKMAIAELADIEAAQKRMSNHQYGICTDCGCAIDYDRLKAYATAKRCARCQSLYERGCH